jgi:hypothetical protein
MAEGVVYEFEGFRLDCGRRQLLDRAGEAIVMPPKVFDTLQYIVEPRASRSAAASVAWRVDSG